MTPVRRRGCIIFAILLFVGIFGCILMPFVIMPQSGIGMAMPVITVPGEVVTPGGFIGGMDLTNTIIGTILADIVLIVFVVLAWRASRGWTKEIPGRFQAFVETLVEGLYSFMHNIGGARLRNTPLLWPLVGTIFMFLLFANLLKLLPGVETVGNAHCAHIGVNGYPLTPGNPNVLYVDSALNSGFEQTAEAEHSCHEYFIGEYTRYVPAGESIVDVLDDLEAQKAELEAKLAAATDEQAEAIEHDLEILEERIHSAENIETLEHSIEALEARIAALSGPAAAADDHGEEAADDHGEEAAAPAAEGEDLATLEAELATQQAALNLAHSQLQYPHATVALTPDELSRGVVPYIFHITPYVRGAATDLSLTITLAIISVVAIQIYGIRAQGVWYFEKFINVTALGNISKKPMGVIDFLVGVFEIISEFSKIVSLAFRLFGNLFAGGVALMAVSFLIALVVPGVLYGLELIIGAVQALVFAVLTLVFSVQAMEGHHGGDEDHGHDHAAEEHH